MDELQKYVRNNAAAIKARVADAPVIVLLDWEMAKKVNEFQKNFAESDPFKVLVWPENACNPELSRAFRGIERHMPNRIIEQADSVTHSLGTTLDKKRTLHSEDYGKFKEEVFKIVQKGLQTEDLVHVRPFLSTLLDTCHQ